MRGDYMKFYESVLRKNLCIDIVRTISYFNYMEKFKNHTNPLDQEERDLKEALDRVDVKKLKNRSLSTQEMFKNAAENYARKDAKMNIRIDPLELEAIKRHAEEEGLKYQPFVRSVLHKYITGRLVEKK